MSAPMLPRHRERAAQCWCAPSTSSIEMDVRLAEEIAQALADEYAAGLGRAAQIAESAVLGKSHRLLLNPDLSDLPEAMQTLGLLMREACAASIRAEMEKRDA